MEALPVDLSLQAEAFSSPAPLTLNSSIELAGHLMGIGALITNCYGQLLTAERADHGPGRTLLSVAETIRRLNAAREAANLIGHPLQVLACTEARAAVALEDDVDARDRKFLSGMKTENNAHVYCGSLDAAISRALLFARHAELVCFRSQSPDLAEAAQFATEVRSSFPGKKLGFGYTPTLDGVRWNELDHRAFALRLRQIGFDFYFVTQFGQTTFPHPPSSGAWVLIDDAVRSELVEPEALPVPATHRMRFPLTHPHSVGRHATFERRRQRTTSVRDNS
jgi:isocitrate lyase